MSAPKNKKMPHGVTLCTPNVKEAVAACALFVANPIPNADIPTATIAASALLRKTAFLEGIASFYGPSYTGQVSPRGDTGESRIVTIE